MRRTSRTFAYRIVDPLTEDADTKADDTIKAILHVIDKAGVMGMAGKNKLIASIGGNRAAAINTIDAVVVEGLLHEDKQGPIRGLHPYRNG